MNHTNGDSKALMIRPEDKPTSLRTLGTRTAALLDGMTIQSIAESCANSGMFKDIRSAWQAIVKIKAGLELGIPPIQAMNGLYIIEGKVAMAATLMAGLLKASGRYTYRVQQHDDNGCVIQFYERNDSGEWVPCGPNSSFTMTDANKAGVTGKSVWKAWPRNMLFARAMSNGARWYCGDVFLGPVYVPEELGVEVNQDGDMLVADVQPENVRRDTPAAYVQPQVPASQTPVTQAPSAQVSGPIPERVPNTAAPVRNSWQREAALTIYPRVAPEVAIEIRQTGANPLFEELEFTRYLVKIANYHVITLPDGIRPVEALIPAEPDVNQEALFDQDGEITGGTTEVPTTAPNAATVPVADTVTEGVSVSDTAAFTAAYLKAHPLAGTTAGATTGTPIVSTFAGSEDTHV